MLEPTETLFKLAEGKAVCLTFFVDVGYLIAAEKYADLSSDVSKVKAQIQEMSSRGHDVQLHIHPHWEESAYVNGKWSFGTENHYKLSDFDAEKRSEIVRKYKTYLDDLIGKKTRVFRAGGWCIQPFEDLREVFLELDLTIDSTVIPGDFFQTDAYAVDFRMAPNKAKYSFDTDVTVEVPGPFTEFPIASMRYSPLFFWRLYLLGRLFPQQHKMIGDGHFLSQGGRKKRVLTSFTTGHVSTDGYFASKLNAGLNLCENKGFESMVVIGHPKGNTQFSVKQLDRFIRRNHTKHQFVTFQQVP